MKILVINYFIELGEDFSFQGIQYFGGVEYHFTTVVPETSEDFSEHPLDVYDAAYDDCAARFGEDMRCKWAADPVVVDSYIMED